MFCSGFVGHWWGNVMRNQHGNPECVRKDLYTGERNNGPESYSAEQLRGNRVDYHESAAACAGGRPSPSTLEARAEGTSSAFCCGVMQN